MLSHYNNKTLDCQIGTNNDQSTDILILVPTVSLMKIHERKTERATFAGQPQKQDLHA
jgi:hypothetical protein